MDRDTVLDKFLEEHVFDQWLDDLIPIGDALNERKEEIEHGLCQTLDTVWRQVAEQQEQGVKGAIHYVYISLLRTGIMENIPHYRIDAYDENWMMDKVECTALWRADFIFEPLFRRMKDLEQVKKGYARKITSQDLDRIKQIEAVKYHLLAIEFIKSMMPALLSSMEYSRIAKSLGINWMAGEFRDQSVRLTGAEEVTNEAAGAVIE
ncbi:hypothetical protein PAECIP111893_00003 [Paenibacillus plantiphilus]|uniref:RsbT co-antagonist protein RsbRD N-terminal domain-containing protein n=1 Tax=Paenibacillus plantiphilus TaxID=2905650 RepID=A0ABN8FQJ4_9BACL|nr:hypothetical protein [Paenibacillus plantiphilus]CAH1189905.1 hypothetical protein PAECIP111893_00003 [Paenibacillus plantiphilus]